MILWVGALCFLGASVYVCVTDITQRRVSNRVVVLLLFAGLAAIPIGGARVSTYVLGLSGAAVGLACWLPLWILGVLGAGDVKYFAAASLWIGPSLSWRAALVGALLGGALAVMMMARNRGLRDALDRAAVLALHHRAILNVAASEQHHQRGETLPYAVPMAVAVNIAWFFPEFLRSLV